MAKPIRLRSDDFLTTREKVPGTHAPAGMAEALAALPAIAGPPAAPAGPAGAPRSAGSRGGGPASPAARPAAPGPAAPGPAAPGPAGPEPGPEPGAPAPLPIRSAERRRWAADLTGPALAGLVLYGAPGIGKSTLASQIASRVSHLEPERVSVVISGEVSVDGVLAGVTAALLRHPALPPGSSRAESVRAAGRADLPWAHRLALLRGEILGHTPVLLVLDNFDGNLTAGSGDRAVRDPALAELLANWAGATRSGQIAHYLPAPDLPRPRRPGRPWDSAMSARCPGPALSSWRNRSRLSGSSASRKWTVPGGWSAAIRRP